MTENVLSFGRKTIFQRFDAFVNNVLFFLIKKTFQFYKCLIPNKEKGRPYILEKENHKT